MLKCWFKGIWQFTVLSAKEAYSKQGNRMIVVVMRIEKNSKRYLMTDYFTDLYLFSAYSFMQASGKRTEELCFKQLDAKDFLNCRGFVEVGTQVWQGKPRPKPKNYVLSRKNFNLNKGKTHVTKK